jgi:small-conductance mechanosensitive channel
MKYLSALWVFLGIEGVIITIVALLFVLSFFGHDPARCL